LIVLIMINVTDSISNSIIGPSLIFYVVEMGGTKSQYGMIMSSSFLSGIIMMGVYGKWIDSNGNKYKQPYMASFGLGILGSLVYFLAILLPKGKLAVATILLGRFITGMGAASRTLAYSYVATAIPRDQQRTILTMMSMTRSFGMMLGPLMNLLVSKVDTSLVLYKDITITVNQNNSVGLIIASGEIFLCTIMFLFLKDPQQLKTQEKEEVIGTTTKRRSLLISSCFDLFLPLVTMFVFMFNFSLYAVTIPPVGNHALGWDPVMISNVLAVQAVVLFIGMCASMVCSMKDVSDFYMIGFGNLCFVIGGTATYVYWTSSSSSSTVAAALKFAIPIFIVSFSYPFLGPANRSKFTKAVHNHKELENKHGAMQALFNQAFMLAGFISPSFVAAFVLRSPNDIDSSDNKHELTSLAWYIPISSSILILLLIY
ncbi:MFS general substrate transporter, partial [Fragilariopsis cylindrus CCMP1102]